MKIAAPYAKILDVPSIIEGTAMLRRIELYARVSHRSEESITPTTYDRFLRTVVLGHGDMSVIEHEKVTVEMLVDRGITHEIVRHRVGSYTQESTRFVNYSKPGHEALFIDPFAVATDAALQRNPWNTWRDQIESAEQAYQELISQGVKPQIARSVFPNALASKIIVTYNLRSWRHFFLMRTSAEAHPQMKEVTIPLLRDFQERIPILFEDITPNEKQSEAMRRLR